MRSVISWNRQRGVIRRIDTLRALMLILFGIVGALAGASPARAHSELISSTPTDGASVSAVSAVTFSFNEELVTQYTEIGLEDGEGLPVALSAVTTDSTGTMVTAEIEGGALSPGSFRATYYVVSIDGHPVEGSISFDVVASESPQPSDSESASASTADQAVSGESAPTPEARTMNAEGSRDDSSQAMWVWIGTGIASVVALTAVSIVLLVAIRRVR